ncbi:uncharacterized protein Dwil_GK14401 [Drosophila willistoni]|uniref:Death-inducer obliterator 1 n=1 Tax=Drosophila willistoni TaxID=7260 RepID=B4NJE9_DROWI|nr:uncharacterized protein LOC6650229 isoform X2 [Drosophila willistoni]EDW84980.2 uncharacterized protein Dwil_GK14401 [Drosophila willistoni]
MSSSVFTETSSARVVADADSNLVVVYGKNGISFDERAIENLMEEKSISTISVVRITSPTPSMLDQEEAERLEELERFLDTNHSDGDDSENEESADDHGSQSDGGDDDEDNSECVEIKSEMDHVTGDDDEDNSSNVGGGLYNDDSTETETEAVRVKKRPGRKPKKVKKRKRRKPKERPQVVGLSVEQFYAETTADVVVKNALKLAGLSIFKRTPETDALLEIIRNDHNYTPFTSPEQMRNHKTAERMAMERQAAQGRKLIMQAPPGNIKLFNTKRRIQTTTTTATTTPPASKILVKSQKHQQQALPKEKPDTIAVKAIQRPGRNLIKIISPPPTTPVEDNIEDDEHAFSSDLDAEEISEESEESRDSDNDRDSDMDFNISRSNRVPSKKKQRLKVPIKRAKQQQGKQLPPATSSVFTSHTPSAATTPTLVSSPVQQQQQQLLRKKPNRVLASDQASPKIGQIIQLSANKAPPTVIALGRNMQTTSFLKMRPAQQQQQPHTQVARKTPPVVITSNEIIRLPTPTNQAAASSSAAAAAAKMRRIPIVQVGRVQSNPTTSGVFTTPPPQEVKEIVINKNIASPKGVFTNLNSLLGESSKIKSTAASPSASSSTPDRQRHMSPMQPFNKGFMPIGVTTASTHKLPAQIVIETHQSSSELAAENDKQLDLINSIVQDELLKSSLIEQPPVNVDESIPKLVKMLESTAEGLDQTASNFDQNPNQSTTVDTIDISNARLLETPDEDEITADFLQHVVGLIEEDKQFEAEVVKQVLASTELDLLNAVPALDSPVPILQQAPDSQLTVQPLPPMASSTPSRSTTIPVADPESPRPDTKIVRGNGRIIYLPPIEAPTTRAKRRAQNTSVPGSMDQSNISLSDYVMDSSNSSISNELVAATSVKRTNPREPSMTRRSAVPRRSHTKMLASQTTDAEASESQEDDDDPNKLWCICRQPHNNRFMICCDLCEDWYHGTCVNVTKAMGLEMEQKGIDWKCPKCIKKKEEMSQPRITDMLNIQGAGAPTIEALTPKKSTPGSASPQTKHLIKRLPTPTAASSISPNTNPPASQTPVSKVLHQQQLNFIKLGASSGQAERTAACVVCKRILRSNSSVYCSDECIRKYAQAAIQQQMPVKTPETPPVMSLSPTTSANLSHDAKKNKKKDLFEDVLRQADISMPKVDRINVFERRTGRALTGHLAPTTQQLKKWLQDNPTFEVLPTATVEKRPIKRSSPPTPETTIVVKPKALAEVAPKTDSIPTTQTILNTPVSRKEREKEKAPVASRVASPVRAGSTKSEPIRVNVRRTLKEQLLARIKEAQEANKDKAIKWLTSLEVEQFAKSVESEMYHSFGRDAGAKYKSKYRSLMFNIKDRKNKTLFEKICAKQVEPKQLVRMTPEQLASQELAKWREEENRHQLDMIKKSELDMLSCTQNYLVNTHKGEEVIDPKIEVTLPDEEAQTEEKQVEVEAKISQSHSSEADGSLERSSSKEKRHKSQKHHHHHRHHHQRNRSRSRSHSRSRSLEKRHRRHPHNNDSEKADGKHDESAIPSPLAASSSPLPKKVIEKKTEETPTKPLPTYNLIDQILESEKTVEQAANLKLPTAKQPNLKAPTKVLPTTPMDKYVRYVQGNEAWSTPLWSGNLHMVDVADFQVIIHPVHGNCQNLAKLLPNKLDVIGRITRVNVWDYIKKIKKSPTKEIIIVNLFPQSPSETASFDQFYEYLDSRQRLGVLGTDSDQIRDFYIFPLGTKDHLPSALQTAERVPFYEDTQRPNTLLGIIVRCLSKRTAAVPIPLNTSANTINSSSSSSSNIASKKSRSATTFTPPTSPKRKRSSHSTSSKDDEFDIDAIIKAPIAKLQKNEPPGHLIIPVDDPNAPYSPGGSSDDEKRSNKGDLERQVQEINKQIAAQQKEIAGLLNVEPSGKPTTSSNILAGISIPPNLSKILASIKESSDTQTTSNALNSEEYNPEDAITTTSSYPVIAARKSRSRLAQLSEAELLSMVPDNLADVAATPATSNTNRYQQQQQQQQH